MSIKASDSPRLWQKKALNLSQLIGTLVWSFTLRWCCCQHNRAESFKKIAANRTWFWLLAPPVAKWSLTLLEKIITLQISFTLINIRQPSFEKPLIWAFIARSGNDNGSQNRCKRSRIQNGPEDLLEVILQVYNHRRVGGARNSSRSNNKCNIRSKSTCHGKNKVAMVATLGGGSASKLVFAIMRILAKTVTSKGLSH